MSEKEHEQWEHWSKALAKELLNIRRDLNAAMDCNSAIKQIDCRIEKWKNNWIPYQKLKEDVKEFDREWADKILNSLPFKCPVHQCGGEMIPSEREPPKDFIESEHFDGDEQTPDLICSNCGSVYQFKGFKKNMR